MTPAGSDGHTRVDLQAPRAPASQTEIARATLHRVARALAAEVRHRTDPDARAIIMLCDQLRSALTAASTAERERDEARAAQRFADARLAFTDIGIAQLAEANERIKALRLQSFEEPTATRDSSETVLAEVEEFSERPTKVVG